VAENGAEEVVEDDEATAKAAVEEKALQSCNADSLDADTAGSGFGESLPQSSRAGLSTCGKVELGWN
jgi:hypothetical protein